MDKLMWNDNDIKRGSAERPRSVVLFLWVEHTSIIQR